MNRVADMLLCPTSDLTTSFDVELLKYFSVVYSKCICSYDIMSKVCDNTFNMTVLFVVLRMYTVDFPF